MMFKQRPTMPVGLSYGPVVDELYLNGLPPCMDLDIQNSIVGSIPGLDAARITRAGHAVEYYFDPMLLRPSLESRVMDGVYLEERAGQRNYGLS